MVFSPHTKGTVCGWILARLAVTVMSACVGVKTPCHTRKYTQLLFAYQTVIRPEGKQETKKSRPSQTNTGCRWKQMSVCSRVLSAPHCPLRANCLPGLWAACLSAACAFQAPESPPQAGSTRDATSHVSFKDRDFLLSFPADSIQKSFPALEFETNPILSFFYGGKICTK